jgi:hypothetical protein
MSKNLAEKLKSHPLFKSPSPSPPSAASNLRLQPSVNNLEKNKSYQNLFCYNPKELELIVHGFDYKLYVINLRNLKIEEECSSYQVKFLIFMFYFYFKCLICFYISSNNLILIFDFDLLFCFVLID